MTIYEEIYKYISEFTFDEKTKSYLIELIKNWHFKNKEASWFENVENKKELKDRIKTIAKNHFEDREEFICAIKNFLEQINFNSDEFIQIEKIYNSIEWNIKLLKFLQEKPRNRNEIAEQFNVSERTLSEHLNKLQDGCNILGSSVKIEVERITNMYDSTIHPVFLALNLSEVYTLTVALKKYMSDTIAADIANVIADDIYRQLSDYAKGIIYDRAKEAGITFNKNIYGYRNEYDEIKREKDFVKVYLLKSQRRCEVYYSNEKKPYYGKLIDFQSNDKSVIKFKCDDGNEKYFKWDKVVRINQI